MYLSLRASYFFKALALCLLLLLGAGKEGYGQTKVLANSVSFTSPDDKMTSLVGCGPISLSACYTATVLDPNNAIIDNNNYARLLASPGLVAGLASYDGEIELKFPTPLPANVTTYIRVNSSSGLFQALLGGSLGNLLGDVLSGVALGSQEFTVAAMNGTNNVFTRTSEQGFNIDGARIVTDAEGNTYIAIRPAATYDRVRITNRAGSLLGLGSEVTLDVYQAFYFSNASDCSTPEFTSFDGTGLTLNILNAGGTGVANPHYAIDDNPNTASEIGVGVLGVAASMSQYIYLSKPSNIGDGFNITLKINNSALLNLGVGDGIVIRAWSGTTSVFEQAFNESNLLGLVNLDLLNSLKSGSVVTVPFAPTVPFDRIEIAVNTTVNASIPRIVNVYDVEIITAKPKVSINPINICYGEVASLSAITQSAKLRWYESQDDPSYIEVNSDNSLGVNPLVTTTYWVSAFNGCHESERVGITVNVNPLPTITLTTPISICEEQISATLPYTSATNDPTTYSIIWDNTSFANIIDASLIPDEIQLSIPEGTLAGSYSGILRVKNDNGCEGEGVPFTIAVHPKPDPPHITAN